MCSITARSRASQRMWLHPTGGEKERNKMKTKMNVLAGCLAFAAVAPVHAQLIAADSYDIPPYTAGTMGGQNPSLTGFTGGQAWQQGSANLQFNPTSLTNSATGYDDASTGKGSYIANSFNFFRRNFRSMDAYTPSNTYYMSMFLNPGGAFISGGRQYAVAGFTNFFGSNEFNNAAGSNNVFGLLGGFRGEDAGANPGEIDLILRARGASGDLENTVLLANAADTTYHVIFKLDINVGGGSIDEVNWWVNPSDLSNEGTLTSSATSTGSVDTFAMNTASDMSQFHVLTSSWARSLFWDETRLGYDLNSVTGIPAPASAGILAIGGLLASRRRR